MNLEAKLKYWKKHGLRGEIIRHAQKTQERINLQTRLIRQGKKGICYCYWPHSIQR